MIIELSNDVIIDVCTDSIYASRYGIRFAYTSEGRDGSWTRYHYDLAGNPIELEDTLLDANTVIEWIAKGASATWQEDEEKEYEPLRLKMDV